MRKSSIGAKLRAYYLIGLALLAGVIGAAITAQVKVDRLTETMDERWLAGTRILGEMADLVSEFRLDGARLALARDATSVESARASASHHREEIARRRAAFAQLPRTEAEKDALLTFDRTWALFSQKHFEWAQQYDLRRMETSAAFQLEADALYEATDDAIHTLIDVNAVGSNQAAETVDRIIDRLIFVLAIVAVVATLSGVWVIRSIRSGVSLPLASITAAFSKLAAGDRDVVVPETQRADEIGEMVRAFDVFRSNTFALQEAQDEAQRLARHDPLTGLTNRRVFSEELEKAFGRADRSGTSFAVLFIDLDRFKPVNDIHGHAAGDAVLCEVADRLKDILRKSDTFSRIGGDEFAIVCDVDARAVEASHQVILFAERVLEVLREPVLVSGRQVEIGASIGIAIGPLDGHDSESMLRAADIAMYRAKRAGRGTFRFYEEGMDKELRARAALEADVRHAVAAGDIEPHYQPLFLLESGALVGFEVLARWHHPERGQVPPVDFVPVIEHLGLVTDFTWGILRRACLDARQWPEDLQLSVNISPIQLRDLTFPARLLSILHETDFSPRRLEIEITETALMTDLETVKSVLVSLQTLGVTVALDDFGTGYSSLYHLRELKLDKIKIDRSFIQSIRENPESNKIVTAILSLARSLSLPTTAEGIEDGETVTQMRALGCDIGQGYFFGKAMPAEDAGALINTLRKAEPRRVA